MEHKKLTPITMKDIARQLGVSVSTVSRALRDSYMISPETKKKILEFATASHFRPNVSAQNLKNKPSKTIGVSISSMQIGFFSAVLSGMESAASQKEYQLIISQCGESAQQERNNIETLQWRGVDGLLVSLSSATTDFSYLQLLLEDGLPIVFFDRVPPPGLQACRVISDNIQGAYDLTRALLQKGYTRIAQVTSQPGLSITTERLQGYSRALAEAGLPLLPEYICYCPQGGRSEAETIQALEALFALPQPPEVIFSASDRITMTTFSWLQLQGIVIPAQVALAGFSNFEYPHLFNPPLTTVSQQAFQIGEAAMNQLILQIEKPKKAVPETVVFPALVNLRQSV